MKSALKRAYLGWVGHYETEIAHWRALATQRLLELSKADRRSLALYDTIIDLTRQLEEAKRGRSNP